MWIASEGKIDEVRQSFGAALSGDGGGAHVAAQDLSDLQVNEMRSMQRFTVREDKAVHALSGRRLEENLEDRGSVDDDQRLCLSARTAAAGARRGRTGWRVSSRLRSSSIVGRSRA